MIPQETIEAIHNLANHIWRKEHPRSISMEKVEVVVRAFELMVKAHNEDWQPTPHVGEVEVTQ